MSKTKPIAFNELRMLADPSRALGPMPMAAPASASARPRNWWYREAFAGAAQAAAHGGRGAGAPVSSPVQNAFDASLPAAPAYAPAPVEEGVVDEIEQAVPLAVEWMQGQPGGLDTGDSRRRWQRLSELLPADPPPPVTAIARSISQASALLDVCALVVELCGGERERPAGTWEATLPLAQQGLGGTLLRLSLSADSLALCFVCDEPRTLDMLRPRVDELHRQLLQQLVPPLALSIDLELA